jgi:hypothetical protein
VELQFSIPRFTSEVELAKPKAEPVLSRKERKDPKKFLIRHQNRLCTGELTLGAGYGWRTVKTHPSLLGASKKHWKELALH